MPSKSTRPKSSAMKTGLALLALGLAGACAAAGQAATETPDQADFGDVRATMTGPVNEATMEIWDVGNNAMSDTGGIDPAMMNESSWLRLAHASDKLALALRDLAKADVIVAASLIDEPKEGELAPGEVSMADVQRYIDADPAAFRELAEGMAKHADEIAMAARFQDADAAGELVAELDLVCETCHSQFWYPEQ